VGDGQTKRRLKSMIKKFIFLIFCLIPFVLGACSKYEPIDKNENIPKELRDKIRSGESVPQKPVRYISNPKIFDLIKQVYSLPKDSHVDLKLDELHKIWKANDELWDLGFYGTTRKNSDGAILGAVNRVSKISSRFYLCLTAHYPFTDLIIIDTDQPSTVYYVWQSSTFGCDAKVEGFEKINDHTFRFVFSGFYGNGRRDETKHANAYDIDVLNKKYNEITN
jgi:hypothetical protein